MLYIDCYLDIFIRNNTECANVVASKIFSPDACEEYLVVRCKAFSCYSINRRICLSGLTRFIPALS